MSDQINVDDVTRALADYQDPESGRSVVEVGQVKSIKVDGSRIAVALGLTTYSAPLWAEAREAAIARLRAAIPQAADVDVQIVTHDRPPEKIGAIGLAAKSVIVVGSGKGGVGKS